MRRAIFALTAIFLGSTAVSASTAVGDRIGDFGLGVTGASIQKLQIAPNGVAASGKRNVSEGNIVLAKGNQAGDGPGTGGHKGKKMGGHNGKQAEGKDNPNKGGQGKGKGN